MGSLTRFATAAFAAVIFMFAAATISPAAPQLKVNLVISADSFMTYAGNVDGMKVGDKFVVMRGESEIGTAEVTRVEATYSILKVVSKSGDIRDMDVLVSPSAAAAVKSSSSGPAKSAPTATGDKAAAKDDKAAAKKDDKKDDKKADTAKKDTKSTAKKDDKKTTEKKTDTKSTAKKEDTKKDTAKKDDKAAAKKDDAKKDEKADAKAEEKKPAKPAGPLTDNTYASPMGTTGLIQIPSAEVLARGKASAIIFRSKKSNSFMYSDYRDNYTLSGSENFEFSGVGIAYGAFDKMELSFAQIKAKYDADALEASDSFVGAMDANATTKQTIYGIKYNPGRKFLMEPTTAKKIQYAIGLQRMNYSTGISDRTIFYGSVTLPMKKLRSHASVYRMTASGTGSKRWGTMAGLEAPITKNLSLIGDTDVFQGDYTYTFGIRYFMRNGGAFSVGYYDIAKDPSMMLTASYGF